jgi:triphosphoribosyl-dephospho-CoA synthetase
MEEARRVLERLRRIEALERRSAPPDELLAELRTLVREAETWLRAEPEPGAAADALARCSAALETLEAEEVALLAR